MVNKDNSPHFVTSKGFSGDKEYVAWLKEIKERYQHVRSRIDLCGDIRFAGQFFEYVYDVGAWTACSDGRFAFAQKGMLKINTDNKKMKFGEGSIFDIEGYNPEQNTVYIIILDDY